MLNLLYVSGLSNCNALGFWGILGMSENQRKSLRYWSSSSRVPVHCFFNENYLLLLCIRASPLVLFQRVKKWWMSLILFWDSGQGHMGEQRFSCVGNKNNNLFFLWLYVLELLAPESKIWELSGELKKTIPFSALIVLKSHEVMWTIQKNDDHPVKAETSSKTTSSGFSRTHSRPQSSFKMDSPGSLTVLGLPKDLFQVLFGTSHQRGILVSLLRSMWTTSSILST